ncbi:hypothetical protein CV014_06225 [Nostoc sp. CMAA1605]|nr:hypothetical protein [Nostoc sp. CMAA1605]
MALKDMVMVFINYYNQYSSIYEYSLGKVGDWGLGIGDWALGIALSSISSSASLHPCPLAIKVKSLTFSGLGSTSYHFTKNLIQM